MKKFTMGLIVGLLLMFSSQAFGSGASYLGKKINGEIDLKVNNEVIGQAVVIEGKSFIPVREIANAYGSAITIEKGVSINLTTQTNIVTNSVKEEIGKKVNLIKSEVAIMEKKVEEAKIKADNDNSEMGRHRTEYAVLKSSLEKQKEKLSILEETLKELQ